MMLILMLSVSTLATAKQVIKHSREWREIENPFDLYGKKHLEVNAKNLLEGSIDEFLISQLKQYPLRSQLKLDLDGDGDGDSLYTNWVHNGSAGKTMFWYTMHENGKDYGWVDVKKYDDGSEEVQWSGHQLFELNLNTKLINFPVNDKQSIYGLKTETKAGYNLMATDLYYFEKKADIGYQIKSIRLLIAESGPLHHSSDDKIQTYNNGFKTMLLGDSLSSEEKEKLYQEKIGRYVLTPEGEGWYTLENNINYYEALQERAKEIAASQQAEQATLQAEESKAKPVEKVTQEKAAPTEPVAASPTPEKPATQVDKNKSFSAYAYWIIGAIVLLILLFVITRKTTQKNDSA